MRPRQGKSENRMIENRLIIDHCRFRIADAMQMRAENRKLQDIVMMREQSQTASRQINMQEANPFGDVGLVSMCA